MQLMRIRGFSLNRAPYYGASQEQVVDFVQIFAGERAQARV